MADFRGQLKRLAESVSAGVGDAAISSASGFVLSFAALQLLDITELGVYAVFFAAYSLAMGLPTELVFTPAEIRAIDFHERERVAVLKASIRAGWPIALLGATLTLLSVPITMGEIEPAGVFAMAASTFVAAVFGPIEEHIRKVLHVAGRSSRAVMASVVMLVAAIVAVVYLSFTPVPRIWIPMSALAFANVASIVAGLLAARRYLIFWVPFEQFKLRELVSIGRWTLIVGFVPSGVAFAVSGIVTALAGADALGYAEAARIVAQPVFVLGVGLLRVLGPRSMEAGRWRDPVAAARHARAFRVVMVGGTLAYLAVVAFPWVGNPFTYLAADAYDIPFLVATVVVANLFIGIGFPERSELYGAGEEKRVASYETLASILTLAAAATAGVTQAFARPLARMAGWVYRVVSYRVASRRLYREAPTADGPGVTGGAGDSPPPRPDQPFADVRAPEPDLSTANAGDEAQLVAGTDPAVDSSDASDGQTVGADVGEAVAALEVDPVASEPDDDPVSPSHGEEGSVDADSHVDPEQNETADPDLVAYGLMVEDIGPGDGEPFDDESSVFSHVDDDAVTGETGQKTQGKPEVSKPKA